MPEIQAVYTQIASEKKDKHGGFVSSCIELQMDGYGNDAADAQEDMLRNVEYYLNANFTENTEYCWSTLADLICDRGSSSIRCHLSDFVMITNYIA